MDINLTPTQLIILNELANTGGTEQEIATALGRKRATVRTHLDNIRSLLNRRTRSELIVWVWKYGEINIDEDNNRSVRLYK